LEQKINAGKAAQRWQIIERILGAGIGVQAL
jgi:hypothetical protein